jgi:hypothetical protein
MQKTGQFFAGQAVTYRAALSKRGCTDCAKRAAFSKDGESIMEIVNGVPCFNCTDVEKAKKAATELPPPETQITAARTFATANAPLGEGLRGTQVNFGV